MWIVRLALRRPYTFVVTALVLLLLTPFVLWRTPTDIFPAISIPVVSVVWLYNGLGAQEIEQRIMYNHERMISTLVNDIEHIESTAYGGAGVIKVFLQPGASIAQGVAQVTASAQAVLRLLPPGTNQPVHHPIQRLFRSDPAIHRRQPETVRAGAAGRGAEPHPRRAVDRAGGFGAEPGGRKIPRGGR